LFVLFSYFASAYVHAPGLPPVQRLPAEIAGPLVQLGQICSRPPILAYASYCLHNWRRIDANGPIALGNIELLQNFSLPGEGKSDEDWFILVHVDIEARAGKALTALKSLPGVLKYDEDPRQETLLREALDGLRAMNKTMDRMPEGCSPEVYFRKVRPYIFGFDKLVYEGCFENTPQSYRGETGAQSSIVPAVLMALGIHHKDSLLTKHLDDMRHYMPAPHRQFIAEQPSVRDDIIRLADKDGARGRALKDLYNACLSEVIAFRNRHFEYAINYIQKKVDNPLATGGTPFVPWLKLLIEESKEFYLK
jgi:indoleamine 2,3-dioxygenase